MSYIAVPTVATGDAWSAASNNKYLRDNFGASVPGIFGAKGDIVAASAADNMSKISVGSDNSFLVADAAEGVGVKWAGLSGLIKTGWYTSTYYWDVDSPWVDTAGDYEININTEFSIPVGASYVFGNMGCWFSSTAGDTLSKTVLTSSSDTTIIYCRSNYNAVACFDMHPFICKVDEDKIILGLPGSGRVRLHFWGYI